MIVQAQRVTVRAEMFMKGLSIMLACVLSFAATTAPAHHKPGHHIPPGHLKKMQAPPATSISRTETVCLVTTAEPDDPYAEVVWTEWLPRPLAERRAAAEGGFIIIHPALQTEEGCHAFLWD
jgi:hypothetical protein